MDVAAVVVAFRVGADKRLMAGEMVFAKLFAIIIIVFISIQRTHSFTLVSEDESRIKSEQIQPLSGTVKVNVDHDTSVIFTDIETGEKYTIVYITRGMSQKIKLQKGKWYTVEGNGNLTIKPVNVRVE